MYQNCPKIKGEYQGENAENKNPKAIKRLILFGFDGTLATPVFTDKRGAILGDHPNTFFYNMMEHLNSNPYKKQEPFKAMVKKVKTLSENEENTIGVLSACSMGSVEVFSKLNFLNDYYPNDNYNPGINWKDNFYGVASTTEKADMLELLANIKDYDEIYYVDGNLESLIDIEALVPRHLLDEKISLFHVTTFVNDIL